MNDAVFYVKGLPTLTKDRFKAACAKRGKNMREVVVAMLELFAESEELDLLTPSELSKWANQVVKQVAKNRAKKKSLTS